MQEPSLTRRIKQPTKMSFVTLSFALLGFNVIGAIVYLVAASPSWAIPQERDAGIYSTTGEPFVWFLGILPVVAIFSIVNLAWGAGVLTRRQWQGGRLWLLTAAVWLGAVVIDFAHH
jgi:hypothetical protein